MAQLTWEKPSSTQDERLARLTSKRSERLKFLIGGLLMLGAIGYLIVSGTLLGQRYFISVNEALTDAQYAGQSVRLTGAVIGSTINETTDADGKTLITFKVAHVPTRTDNIAEALNIAANDPNATTLAVEVRGQPRPELLRHESQAILMGKIGVDGVFYATNMQFKCPSRFEEVGPEMQGSAEDHPGIKALGGRANAG